VAHHHDLGWNWFDPSLLGAGAATLAAVALIATAAPRVSPALIIMEAEVSVTATTPPPSSNPALQPTESEKIFLDRLMMAESGGREDARNPRSSALGPYQFLGSTFLDVMGRYFPMLTSGKSDEQVLQLRTDHAIARDAALVYTRENAAVLLDRGLEANAAHLRLAFLVGATGAQRVIAAHAETPVAQLLSSAALEANPFLRGMTAAELIQRAAAEASGVHIVSIPENVRRPKFAGLRVRCSLARPSCRKWVALAMKRKGRNAAAQATGPEAKPGSEGAKKE
jgi:hypothetical protein